MDFLLSLKKIATKSTLKLASQKVRQYLTLEIMVQSEICIKRIHKRSLNTTSKHFVESLKSEQLAT